MSDGTRIRVLDHTTAARIAAGEVVERPSNVVKELVENAVDAGATRVDVDFEQGGRRRIRVSDNGIGIAAADVEVAFRRHATSKIATSDDLAGITTLGFRGEALASIAAVSHLTMVTRRRGEASGTRIRFEAGELALREPVGAPVGTVITVENLFHAVPARLKFLRSDVTEARRILDAVSHLALGQPTLRFEVTRDGRRALLTTGGGLDDVAASVLGRSTALEMLPFEAVADITVTGLISPPHLHRANRRQIFLLVNGRPIQDASLGFAAIQAYHTLLPKGRFPIAVIAIEMAPDQVDVNVHPAKTEVRFRQGRTVFAAVQRAVRGTLVGSSPVAPLATGHDVGGRLRSAPPSPRRLGEAREQGSYFPAAAENSEGLQPLRPLGQVAGTFIVAEGPDGLYVIDQHAAHERIVFERLMAREGPPRAQRLLEPATVRLTAAALATLEAAGDALTRLGLEIEPFGADTVLLRSLPEVLAEADPAGVLADVLDALAEAEDPPTGGGGAGPVERALEERIARIVCKRATVKAGQTLKPDEIRTLLRDLEAAESPRTCPHGRPTMTVLSRRHLEREFGRH